MGIIRSLKLQNLSGSSSWYSIRNAADGPAQVSIYDEIGFVGVTAGQFLNDISKIKGDIELHLNTPGGEVFDGIAIYNALKQRGNVKIVVDSLAASIGSVIAMAGNPLEMTRNSQLMIHDGFGMTVGNAADMRQMADLLDKTSDNIASIYAERTGKPEGYWRDLMKNETWFSAQESVKEGLADRVQEVQVKNQADFVVADDSNISSKKKNKKNKQVFNEKYNADDRKRMAEEGSAMPDGSYPINDEEDLDNAIHAVGRGGADHDAIRRHIIKRAKALGKPDAVPDNWNADGSLNNLAQFIYALRNF